MTVTVGIATTGDDPGVLRRTVAAALRSASPLGERAEVLVVVNGRDRVPELAGLGSPLLRVLYLPRRNVAAARNTVLSQARNDAVLFTDDDCAVPPGWCQLFRDALADPACPVVTAPVRLDVAGPVSAYINAQRLFDAVPAGPDEALVPVTANCGLRRDRIPAHVRFDERLDNAGEDSEFGLALRAAGLRPRWLGDAEPVVHGLSEDVEEITDRFARYGRARPRVYLHCGRSLAAMPGILRWYRMITADGYLPVRRFAEVVPAEARDAFATYHYLMNAATIVGYLDGMAAELGYRLLDLDLDALRAAWRDVGARVAQRAGALSPADWRALPIDYARVAAGVSQPAPLLDAVRESLRRHAATLAGDPPATVTEVLDRGVDASTAEYQANLERVGQAWKELTAGGEPVTAETVEARMRAIGVAVSPAGEMIEYLALLDRRGPGGRRRGSR